MADIEKTTWPRWVTIVASAWLFISAFVWPHSAASIFVTCVTAAAMLAISIGALFAPTVRFANTAISLWLIAAAFLLPHISETTFWNDFIVAIIVFLMSLTPSRDIHHRSNIPLAST